MNNNRNKHQLEFYQLTILTLLFSISLVSCDPVHLLMLENQTKNKIEVIYYPALEKRQIDDKKTEVIEIKGQKMTKLILEPTETISIGTVVAMYTPSAQDIDLNYLEIRSENDTIQLTGKNAILTTIQKVGNLNWRLIVK